jgi:HlyD family secretion protein
MKKKTLLWSSLAVATLVALVVWAFAPRPVEIEVATAAEGPFETTIDEDGKTRLHERYVVSAPLAGRLARIALRAGDAVEAGAVVAWLQPAYAPMLDDRSRRELEARVETAQARVRLAAARIERARVAQQQAQNELQRSEQLAGQGFVSATQLDNSRLALQAARRELEAAQQERRVAEASLDEARAALYAVRNPGAPGASPRDFAVRAPEAGRVLRVLQASESVVAIGTPLVEVGDTTQLEIVAELLTADALQVKPGTTVRIERWGGPAMLEGRVQRVEPAAFTKVSALGVEEQRVNVVIDIVSPAEQWRSLGDGFRVGLRLVTLSLDKALLVPVSAVFPLPQGEGMGVFRLDEGRARITPVELGARNGEYAWVKRGLDAGATVIVYPPTTVRDGVRVKARRV